MRIRFFASSSCKDCLQTFILLNKYQINYDYVDALEDDDKIQKFCDENNVDELPHLQFINKKNEIILEHIGSINEKELLDYLLNYFPNY